MAETNHAGHRERMRKRFMKSMSFDGFNDHEILELLLFYCIPRGNTNEIAHRLISRYGSLGGVLNADYNDLCDQKDIGEKCAAYLKIICRTNAYCHLESRKNISITDIPALKEYIILQFSGENEEVAKLFCVDNKSMLSHPEELSRGTNERVAIDIRRAAKVALQSSASWIILAHSHPNGECKPSSEDIATTRRLSQALSPLGIGIIDHFIVADNKICSMRELGLITSF